MNNSITPFKAVVIGSLVLSIIEFCCSAIYFSITWVLMPLSILMSIAIILSAYVIKYIETYCNRVFACNECNYFYKLFKSIFLTIAYISIFIVPATNLIGGLIWNSNSDLDVSMPLVFLIVDIIPIIILCFIKTKFTLLNLKLLKVEYLHQINKKIPNPKDDIL